MKNKTSLQPRRSDQTRSKAEVHPLFGTSGLLPLVRLEPRTKGSSGSLGRLAEPEPRVATRITDFALSL